MFARRPAAGLHLSRLSEGPCRRATLSFIAFAAIIPANAAFVNARSPKLSTGRAARRGAATQARPSARRGAIRRPLSYDLHGLAQTTAGELPGLRRTRWSIENSLRRALDAAFKEDDAPVRMGRAAVAANILFKTAFQPLKADHSANGSLAARRWEFLLAVSIPLRSPHGRRLALATPRRRRAR